MSIQKVMLFVTMCSLVSFAEPFKEAAVVLPVVEPVMVVEEYVSPLAHVPEFLQEDIITTCLTYRIPIGYFTKMLEQESGFDPAMCNTSNVNGTTDDGLVQVNSAYRAYFEWKYGIENFDPYKIEHALEFAGKHLAFLYGQTGDWELAFASYNAGLERVKSGDIPASTIEYVDIIFGRM